MQIIPTKRWNATPTGGSGAAKGLDFVGVVLFFAFVGWMIDRALGTRPLFVIGLLTLGFVGQTARIWYAYDAEMRQHEARAIGTARRSTAPPAGSGEPT